MKEYKSSAELREIAEQISNRIVIRTYVGGNSYDNARKPTKKQKQIIFDLAYGTLLSLNHYSRSCKTGYGESAWATIGTAEFQCDIMLEKTLKPGEECNGYDTIYLPLMRAFDQWAEERADSSKTMLDKCQAV